MKYVIWVLLICILSFFITGCVHTSELTVEQIKHRIELIPVDRKNLDFFNNFFARRVQKIRNPTLRAVAKANSFPKWKTYEDEYISFDYPDDPNIKLEIKSSKDRIRVCGGIVGTTENFYSRAYRLSFGEYPYCVLMLNEKNYFDDGICFCGAIAFTKYLFRNGGLFRYELLRCGYVKKVQVLSNEYRVVVFEWPHLLIQQDPYIKIASSIKMKKPADKDKLIMAAKKKYGVIGFIARGMNKKQVIEVLGRPSREEQGKFVYERKQDRTLERLTVNFGKSGVFEGLRKGWRKYIEVPPEKGTIDWIWKKVNPGQDYNEDLAVLTDEDAKIIFNSFMRLTPKASYRDWERLCWAIYVLATKNYQDDKIMPVFMDKYASGPAPHIAHVIIAIYKPQGKNKLLLEQLRMIYKKKGEIKDENIGHDVSNILYSLTIASPHVKEMVIEGMKHPNDNVREEAYRFWHYLPDAQAIVFIRAGLKDKDSKIRQECAEAFSKRMGHPEDITLLKNILKIEKNKNIRKILQKAVLRLSAKKSVNR